MADYPCDIHLGRYNGPSVRAYLNLYREDQAVKLKASMCGDCLAELVQEWLSRALHQTPGGSWDPGEEDQTLECLWIDAGRGSAPLNGRGRY
jgi:hypothetical protein